MNRFQVVGLVVVVALLVCGGTALAEADAHPYAGGPAWVDHVYATGPQANDTLGVQRVDQHVVRATGALSLRLVFTSVTLGPDDSVDVYSPISGETHVMTADAARLWQNTSAYLPGDEVFVYLTLAPGSTGSYELAGALQGLPEPDSGSAPASGTATESICGDTDDRAHSTDKRVGRFMYDPGGGTNVKPWCTAWLAGPDDCVVTAGHCVDQNTAFPYVVEFDVPVSTATGAFVRASVDDQYVLVAGTLLWAQVNPSRPNDWAVFRLGPNAQTYLGPSYVQGTWFTVSTATPAVADDIRITGFGSIPASTADKTLNTAQHTHHGPYVSGAGDVHRYQVDTYFADSGSPIIHTSTGDSVGIHTNAGCGDDGSGNPNGSNSGTAASHAPFQVALTATCDQANELDLTCDADTTVQCTGNNSAQVTTHFVITDPQINSGTFFVFLNGSTTPTVTVPFTTSGSGVINGTDTRSYPLGTTEWRGVIQGNDGSSADCFRDITVEDNVAPTVTCTVSRRILFPPRGALILPGLPTKPVHDDCDPNVAATLTVYSDEADAGPPFSPDVVFLAGGQVLLRAERAIQQNGRVYLLVVHGKDQANNETFGACAVGVPRLTRVGSIMATIAEMATAVGGVDLNTGVPTAPYTNVVLPTAAYP